MSTWHAHVRIEHRGQYSEYNDKIGAAHLGGGSITEQMVVEEVIGMILKERPEMKAGKITVARASLIR